MPTTAFPETSRVRTRELIREWQDGGPGASDARDEVIRLNMGLFYKVVNRLAPRFRHLVEESDLEQAGAMGLMRAIEGFDLDRGGKFSSYAIPWIRSAISHDCLERSTLIHIPRGVAEANADPSKPRTTSMTVKLKHANRVLKFLDCDDERIAIVSPEESNHDRIDQMDALRSCLRVLTAKEYRLIEMRYGLNGVPEKNLREAGEHFGITWERARQLVNRGLAKLARESKRRNDSLLSLIA